MKEVPKQELLSRLERFTNKMSTVYPNWELCVITGGVNMYYLSGTICDGVMLIKRDNESTLWVRRSFERALIESALDDIRPMKSFKEIAGTFHKLPDTVYIDMANTTLEWFNLFKKYMPFNNVLSLDSVLMSTRAVKSSYEIANMNRAGRNTDSIFRETLPALIKYGASEECLGIDLLKVFINRGFHGISRFNMRNVDSLVGHIAFGENSLYPSAFNGAAGIKGLCAAAPVLGSFGGLIKKGTLIYVDIAPGIKGYHVDKTVVLSYNKPQPKYVIKAHMHCLELERLAASMLKPGVRPCDIYDTATAAVNDEYKENFMGAKGRTVPFIGHGVGLNVDEMPVIARGFTEPLEENMTIAIEPKISIEGKGMVGSENTYLVTEYGGSSLTGEQREIEVV